MWNQKIVIFVFILMIQFVMKCDKIDPNYTYDDFMKQFNLTYEGDEKLQH